MTTPRLSVFPFWRYRDFSLLWAGQMGSMFGDTLFASAVLIFVYNETHSPTASVLVFLATTAPHAVLGLFAGALADRVDRRRLIVAADSARAIVLLPLLVTAASSHLWVLVLVLAAGASLGSVFMPAYAALLPATLPTEQLAAANSFNAATRATAGILGAPAGAILLSAFGLTPLVLLNVVSFVGSIVTVACVSARTAPTVTPPYRRDLVEGLSYLRRNRVAAVIIASAAVFGLGTGMISPLAVPFFRNQIHASTAATGAVFGAMGVGAVFGGALSATVLRRLGSRRTLMFGDAVAAAVVVGLAAATTYSMAISATVILGVANGLSLVAEQTLLQTSIPSRYLGRVFGALSAVTAATALLSAGVPLILVHSVGVRGLFWVAAALAAVGAGITWIGLGRTASEATLAERDEPAVVGV